MRVHAACVLDAGNHFPAPGTSLDCPTELYFEVGHSINNKKSSVGQSWELPGAGKWFTASRTHAAWTRITLGFVASNFFKYLN